ncbi:SDR family NAD(P)-dependent oxidoreductase [Pseudonocardia ailaonensis]|uniref:SDR family NAD(P)-dependent oxidoreductase n=1 Tax=Pseudonocardia ailaonensis TaxID=367279 RepID=A0ABN2MVB9_9PSEU
MKLESGQVAVVTGAASGIGRAVVAALAARGLTVVAADVEKQALEALGIPGVETAEVDVRDFGQLASLADDVVARHGRVDLVMANAGVNGPRAYTWEQSEQDWRWITDVNYLGALHTVRAFVPHLVQAGRGHVVTTSSVTALGLLGGGITPYAATKHAVLGMSEWLDHELRTVAPGVRTTIFCPGPVGTRIRDAGRNRPAQYDGGSTEVTPLDPAFTEDSLPSITAEQAAEELMAGIEADRLYLPVGPGVADRARDRLRRILADL